MGLAQSPNRLLARVAGSESSDEDEVERCVRFSISPGQRLNSWDGQRPPAEARGLVSKLHRNSAYLARRAALVSTLDTSGRSDKTPVLAQSCRTSNVRSAIFLAPTRSAWRV